MRNLSVNLFYSSVEVGQEFVRLFLAGGSSPSQLSGLTPTWPPSSRLRPGLPVKPS